MRARYIAAFATLFVLCVNGTPAPCQQSDSPKSGPVGSPRIELEDASHLISFARPTLGTQFGLASVQAVEPPEGLLQIPFHDAWIRLRIDHRLRAAHGGRGPTLVEAVRDGVLRAIADSDYGGPLMAGEVQDVRIEILIPVAQRPILGRTVDSLERALALGGHVVKLQFGNQSSEYRPYYALAADISTHRKLLRRL